MKDALAEERPQEAAHRARSQYEYEARQRLQRETIRDAERRLGDVAQQARRYQELAAALRLQTKLREEKHALLRDNWASMRSAAERSSNNPSHYERVKTVGCSHSGLGWSKKRGAAFCGFCGSSCTKYDLKCPQCEIRTCQVCRNENYAF